MLASVAPRLRQATVTCSYADQVTIYNCRICEDMGLWARANKDETPHLTEVGTAFVTRVFG